MSVFFGRHINISICHWIGHPDSEDRKVMSFSLEHRLKTAHEEADRIRRCGGKAEVLQHQWYDSLHPEEIRDRRSTLYSAATHSGGQKMPPDVIVFDGDDADGVAYLKQVQNIIEKQGIDTVCQDVAVPVYIESCKGKEHPYRFDTAAALAFLKQAKLPKPSIIAEFMRAVFNNNPSHSLIPEPEPGQEYEIC